MALGENGPLAAAPNERPGPVEVRNLADLDAIIEAREQHRAHFRQTAPKVDTTGWFRTARGSFIGPSLALSRWMLLEVARRAAPDYDAYLQRWGEKHNFPICRFGDWRKPDYTRRYFDATGKAYHKLTGHDLAEQCRRVARGELKYGLRPIAEVRAEQSQPKPRRGPVIIERRVISLGPIMREARATFRRWAVEAGVHREREAPPKAKGELAEQVMGDAG